MHALLEQALNFFRGRDDLPGLEPDMRWAWLTIGLSAAVAAGYAVIAVNWYFQSKVAARREARAAMRRLGLVAACCGAFGAWFFANDMSWPAWRAYDLVLAVLAAYTWWFALRMRGPGLVDERLAQAQELERSAGRYRDIAELVPNVVWTATADGRVDYSNRRWAAFAGDGAAWTDRLHPDDRDDVLAWWQQALRERAPVTREVRLADADGGYRTFVLSASPLVRGEAVKWLGACADVEDQKRLTAEKEAQARQKTFFLNSLSHDLRAPLNNVVLNAHLLKMSASDPAQAESAALIVDNAVAAGELVNKLLECARFDGPDGAAADVVPLASVARQVARRFQRIAEQKGLSLRVVAGEGEGPEVLADRQKLERVVSNLLDNAIKFTEAGGVTVEVAGGTQPRVRVRDTGIGVPEEAAPHLFDEFYQVHNHERDRSKGFGMGLAICRSLARQFGGDVRLAGTGAGGSCFEVVLDARGPGGGRRPGGAPGGRADLEAAGV
jgi:PAS domain S-box-containing protein